MIERLDKGQHIKGTPKETRESCKDVWLVMPVLAKFLSTKFVAHSNCSYKDHLFFLLSGEKFLKFYWFDAYEDRFKQPGRVWSRLLDSWIIKKITRFTVSFECSVNYSVSYRYCIPFWKGLDWSCKSICEVINVYLHFVFLFNPSTNYALTKYHLVDSQPLIKSFPIYILAACSVAVKNIERQIFILPREKVGEWMYKHCCSCWVLLACLFKHYLFLFQQCFFISFRSLKVMVLKLMSLLGLLMFTR